MRLRRIRRGSGTSFGRRLADRTLPGEGRSFFRDVIVPGGVAGTVGGALMMALYMVGSAAFGGGFWTGPKLIGAIFWRDVPSSAQLGFWAVIIGLAIHFAVSVGWATAWAMIVPRYGATHFATMPLAIAFAGFVYIVMNFFIAGYLSPPMRREVIAPIWFIAHLAWAAPLGLIQPLRRYRRHVLTPTAATSTTPPGYPRHVHA